MKMYAKLECSLNQVFVKSRFYCIYNAAIFTQQSVSLTVLPPLGIQSLGKGNPLRDVEGTVSGNGWSSDGLMMV